MCNVNRVNQNTVYFVIFLTTFQLAGFLFEVLLSKTSKHLIRAQVSVVDQDAQAADRNTVPAPVINVVDSDSGKDESIIATSDSEESGSETETAQNEPASTLASDSEQYALRRLLVPIMETSGHTVGRAHTPEYQSSIDCSLGRNTETCNFSALVIAQGEAPLILKTPQ